MSTDHEAGIVAYKAFDADWTCREMQYAVGETFTYDGDVSICESGLHACERPLDVLRYYRPGSSKFAIVRATGKIERHADDSKIAAASLTVEAEIGLPELVAKTISWTLARCVQAKGASTDKDNGAVTASGDYGAATASGHTGAATASGDSGAATASGYSGAATASGDYGAATASGYSGAATASGHTGAATASGYSGKARGAKGCVLFLVRRDLDWKITHAKALIVGQDGIKADTFYSLDVDGNAVEAA